LEAAVRGPGIVLGFRLDLAGQPAGQGSDEQASPQGGQLGGQGAGSIVGRYGQFRPGQDGAGIHALVHAHEADTGHGIAGQDGRGDGGGSAPTGQQGAVNIQAASRGQRQHRWLEDLAKGGDDHDVGLPISEAGQRLGGAECVRLVEGQIAGQGLLFDGRKGQLAAATGRPVGLGDDAHDPVLLVQGL
jgi:hypothetical protein